MTSSQTTPSQANFAETVTIHDIKRADAAIRPAVLETPLLTSDRLNAVLPFDLYLKAESLQRTGSFKFRGAWNAISALKPTGVVAFSSGNHAQGVALSARLQGLPAVIIMPSDAPTIKIENTRGLGAEVVLYDRATEDRDAIGESVQVYVAEAAGRRCIVSFESTHGLRWIVPEGSLLPLSRGSAGRLLAGHRLSVGGWIESVEEREKGVASVSAPIFLKKRLVWRQR